MNLRECMTDHPTTVQATQSIHSAAMLMRERDVGFLPVLVADRIVGLLTDRDIVIRAVATGLDLDNHQVQEVMTTAVTTASPDTTFEEAAQIMSDAQVRRLPVIIDSKLVGIVSLGDIVVAHQGHEELCGSILESVSQPVGPKHIM